MPEIQRLGGNFGAVRGLEFSLASSPCGTSISHFAKEFSRQSTAVKEAPARFASRAQPLPQIQGFRILWVDSEGFLQIKSRPRGFVLPHEQLRNFD